MSEEKNYDDADWVKSRIQKMERLLEESEWAFVEAFNNTKSTEEYKVEMREKMRAEMRRCKEGRKELFLNVKPKFLRRCLNELGYLTNGDKINKDGKIVRERRRRRVRRLPKK